MLVKKFLRLFTEYRELEQGLEREAALNDSLERYIDTLEGRDRERLARIEELEGELRDAFAVLYEALETAADLKARLNGLRSERKEDES
jgi:hypothetical protein